VATTCALREHLVALLLALGGLLLTASVEFVFLSDTFGTRMNTVFKFYYQGWVLMAWRRPTASFTSGSLSAGRGWRCEWRAFLWSVGTAVLWRPA
jgi:uncharacterized membrane protein